jgi:hypothetical protein
VSDKFPAIFHSEEGDFLEVYLSRREFTAEWISKNLTLYWSRGGNKLVGFMLENVSKLTKARAKPRRDKKEKL